MSAYSILSSTISYSSPERLNVNFTSGIQFSICFRSTDPMILAWCEINSSRVYLLYLKRCVLEIYCHPIHLSFSAWSKWPDDGTLYYSEIRDHFQDATTTTLEQRTDMELVWSVHFCKFALHFNLINLTYSALSNDHHTSLLCATTNLALMADFHDFRSWWVVKVFHLDSTQEMQSWQGRRPTR
jgi:hypothetical protein